MAAAIGVILFFVGAIITHVRARWYSFAYPSVYLPGHGNRGTQPGLVLGPAVSAIRILWVNSLRWDSRRGDAMPEGD